MANRQTDIAQEFKWLTRDMVRYWHQQDTNRSRQ